MPDKRDEIQFTMVNGDTIRKTVPLGEGQAALAEVTAQEVWIEIDAVTRIRADKIVSVTLAAEIEVRAPITSLD